VKQFPTPGHTVPTPYHSKHQVKVALSNDRIFTLYNVKNFIHAFNVAQGDSLTVSKQGDTLPTPGFPAHCSTVAMWSRVARGSRYASQFGITHDTSPTSLSLGMSAVRWFSQPFATGVHREAATVGAMCGVRGRNGESWRRNYATQTVGTKLDGVKHVIAVASGKGGVGKSTTAGAKRARFCPYCCIDFFWTIFKRAYKGCVCLRVCVYVCVCCVHMLCVCF
jgi:hypothetical protein